jgi:hypothetical protein
LNNFIRLGLGAVLRASVRRSEVGQAESAPATTPTRNTRIDDSAVVNALWPVAVC